MPEFPAEEKYKLPESTAAFTALATVPSLKAGLRFIRGGSVTDSKNRPGLQFIIGAMFSRKNDTAVIMYTIQNMLICSLQISNARQVVVLPLFVFFLYIYLVAYACCKSSSPKAEPNQGAKTNGQHKKQ